jgi:protein involved in polysaccharide export with SLBB domain
MLFGMLLVLAGSRPSPAQQAGASLPSSEQMELLRNLTPEQRELVLRELGADGSEAGEQPGRRRTRTATEPTGAAGEEQEQDDTGRPDGADAEGQKPGRKSALRPDDSVLIDLAFIKPRLVVPPGSPPGTAPEPEPEEPIDPVEKAKLVKLIELIRSRNPYRLDAMGMLQLPGYPGIALAGLNDEQATRRLQAEPSFARFEIRLSHLPLTPVGVASLKPFGYDLFDEDPSTFSPVTDAPVPADYVVGPGDELRVQLYGNQNRNLRLVVGRDGRVNFPELGPIVVGGQRFESVRSSLESRVQRQMIGVRASVSIGETRAIRVFVLGEARRPGSYSISGLGTVTTALFAAGGVRPIGSLRDVQLKRQGATIRRLDLYDLLLRGDTSNDAKLMPGDVVFVPPVAATVTIEGQVRRPAIYELKGDVTVAAAVQLAGGLTAEADSKRATVERVDEDRRRVAVDIDMTGPDGRSRLLRNGDVLRVARVRQELDSGVVLRGHMHTPRTIAWREGLRLSDAITSVDELKPNADLGYVLVRREIPPDRRIVVLSADLSRAWRARGGEADLRLNPRDQVMVFDLESGREREIQRLMEEIRLQARIDRPTAIVRVGGRVRVPGEYPLEPNMTVSDLVRAGGNLSDAAYGGTAELTRYTVEAGEARRAELIEIDLAKVLMGDKEADVALRPFDYLNIKEIPEWTVQEEVTLKGEVRFPGTYPIKRGETLRSVLQRAGGLTELAFPQGGVFTRENLREREQEQLDVLATRIQNDLASMALQAAAANQSGAAQTATVGQSLLSQLKATKAVGRLVIDVEKATAGGNDVAAEIVLQDGDTLMIPQRSQEVTVIGEVQNSTSHLYRANLSRDEYIRLSGGMTRKADDDLIYVVRANGSVVASEGSGWRGRGSGQEIRPGDTIVVPLDTERLPTLPLWQAVTQILYNLAIAAAAVNSF